MKASSNYRQPYVAYVRRLALTVQLLTWRQGFSAEVERKHTHCSQPGVQMRWYLFLRTPSIRHLNGFVFCLSTAKTGLIQLGLPSIETDSWMVGANL